MEELTKLFGIEVPFEKMTKIERETFYSWLDSLQKTQLTIPGIKEYVEKMRDSVEQELTKPNLDHDTDLMLKARLRNYMLFIDMLTSPDRAKQAIKRALENVK